MNVVDRIKEQHRLAMMQQLEARPHRCRIMHLDKVKSVGIIASGLTERERETLTIFSHDMDQRGIRVWVIEQPSEMEGHVDKYGLPKREDMQLFTSYHYDVLVDTTLGDEIYGPFVTLNTSSTLRVGYGGEPPEANSFSPNGKGYWRIYDLMILGKGPFEMGKYLNDIIEYLRNIRK